MDFCNFKRLDLPEQIILTSRIGVSLCKRVEDNCIVCLYQVNNFYVEIFYNWRSSEIIKIISFHSTILLEPYIKQIKIESIFIDRALITDPIE